MATAKELLPEEKVETTDEGKWEGRYFKPRVDIWEDEDALYLQTDAPGVDPDHFDIDLKDNTLTIVGKVLPFETAWKPVHTEYEVGHFSRQFRLGQQIDQTSISAEYDDGVLTLVLPKAESVKPRRIEVK